MRKKFIVAITLAGGLFLSNAGFSGATPALLSLRGESAFEEIPIGRFRLEDDSGRARMGESLLAMDWSGRPVQVSSVAPASRVAVRADASSVSAGMTQEFSTWSDLTAVFRPSRWRLPIRVGEPLSFLNYRAWKEAPGRTAKILVGVVVVAGVTYAVVGGASGGGGGGDRSESAETVTPVPVPTTRPTSGGGGGDTSSGDTSDSGSSGGTSDSGSSGGGDTSGGDTGGGDESPF